MRELLKLISFLLLAMQNLTLQGQPGGCVLKPPFITIHFGKGNVRDLNTVQLSNYERINRDCPPDGYYTYTSYTSSCFHDDWLTLTEDHTPGDVDGNMMIVNASHSSGVFLMTPVEGFKGGTTYEFGAWLMNVCRASDKCPYPLLPNLIIRLQTASGKVIAQIGTGELPRHHAPQWTHHRARFTTPPGETKFLLTMTDIQPGGCGNDFALDDITFRECAVPPPPPPPIVRTPVKEKKKIPPPKPVKETVALPRKQPQVTSIQRPKTESIPPVKPEIKTSKVFPPAPLVLKTRSNPLVKQIDLEAGEIRLDLYDNGEIDGDTVTIYHNNILVVEKQRLSQKPITFRITIDQNQPHHEIVMVAENLGSIPPNTSLMMVTAGSRRYQVFLSSSEQKNARVIFNLKQ